MGDDIRTMGGAYREEIALMIANAMTESRNYTDKATVDLRAYVDAKNEQQRSFVSASVMGLESVLKLRIDHSDEVARERHDQTSKSLATSEKKMDKVVEAMEKQDGRIDKLDNKWWMALGIAIGVNACVQVILWVLKGGIHGS